MKADQSSEPPSLSAGTGSFVQWAGLHVTGLLLATLVGAHLWSVHYGGHVAMEGFTFASVAAKLRHPIYRVFDLGLLVLALFHGLLGTHRIIGDVDLFGRGGMRLVTAILIALGLGGLWYGWSIYRAFIL